jgi:hypothetical protein
MTLSPRPHPQFTAICFDACMSNPPGAPVDKWVSMTATGGKHRYLWQNHVAFMLHGGFVTPWKPLEMRGSMLHKIVQHKGARNDLTPWSLSY